MSSHKKSLLFIFYLILFLHQEAASFSLMDVADQTAAGPLLREEPIYNYTTAVGVSSYLNSVQVSTADSMTSTNRNSYLLGLDINGSNTVISLPFKDPDESTRSRVDSQSFFLQSNFTIYKKIKTEVIYISTRGYYIESDPTKNSPRYLFPNLGFEKAGLSFSLLSNPKHFSFLFSPVLFSRGESSTSWIYGVELDRYFISNMNDLKKYPHFSKNSALENIAIYSFSAHASYSKTSFYKNWFWGGAFGLSLNSNQLLKNYSNSNAASESNINFSALLNLSAGYAWKLLTLGVFTTTKSFSIVVDDYEINNSVGKAGTYLSYKF